MVNVAGFFTDPDGDALVYTAASSNPSVATVSVSGSVVTVNGIARGVVAVTVTAQDPGGLSAQATFEVTVPNQAPVPVDTVPVQTVFVGDTARLDMATYFNDPDGDLLTFTAASSNETAVSVSVAGSVVSISAIATGTAVITVTAADPDGLSAQHSFEVTVPNRAPIAVGSLPAQTLAVGQTVAVDVSQHFNDPDNDSLTYAATATDTAVALATVSDNVLMVTARARGTTGVTVTATDPGGLSGQQSFEVTVPNQAPVVRDSIESGTLGVGEIGSWTGPDLFRDPDGDSLTYAARSSNLEVVRPWVTDDVLLVQGLSPGTATVTFSAFDPEGLRAQIVFDITVLGPVSISGTDPFVLLEGAPATVFGSGFSPIVSENQVFVGGLVARVTEVTGSSLSIEMPRADCLPPRHAELRVNVRRRSDARTVGVTPRSREDLELPQRWYRYTRAGDGCLHLPGNASGGEYLIGVVSVSEDPASLTGVTLTGTPGDAGVVAADAARIVVGLDLTTEEGVKEGPVDSGAGPRPLAAEVANTSGFEQPSQASDTLRSRQARAHSEMMARNEALVRTLGRASRPALSDARRELQAGDTLTLHADYRATCSAAGQIRAVVRLVGNSTVWLDDRDNPAPTFTDFELADLDAFYSASIKRVHDDYFGVLSDVDANGRVLVLMTKEVNRAAINGWVWAGDLYPREQCATSNQGEIFYGLVPDPNGVYARGALTREQVRDDYRSLIAHEIAHVIQFGSQVFDGAGRKASWELEGGATLAEQLVAYGLFGHGSGRELGYAEYSAGADWYSAWLPEMALFFGWDSRGDGYGRITGAPEECSWVGRPKEGNSGPCQLGGREVYGVPSMVLRYAMDRWGADYPGGERAMLRRVTQSPWRGFTSLVDISPDQSWAPEKILTDFYITLWLDLQGWHTYGMSTWNLQDIFGHLLFNTRLQPYTSFANAPRLAGHRIRGGSALYFHWTPRGPLSPTSVRVTTTDGGPVLDHIAVWGLRVR